MNTEPVIRLHLFFARNCDRAVILRQGPSKVFRMILWDRRNDVFEDGQWLKHKVYVERCDLSPDGKHFIYFALDGRWGTMAKGSYTAISKPPFFTALALFPEGDTWGGGGRLSGRPALCCGRRGRHHRPRGRHRSGLSRRAVEGLQFGASAGQWQDRRHLTRRRAMRFSARRCPFATNRSTAMTRRAAGSTGARAGKWN